MHTHTHPPATRHKAATTLRFHDTRARMGALLMLVAAGFVIGALVLLSISLRQSVAKQQELTQLIGLAEAQGGDLSMARAIYGVMQEVQRFTPLPPEELPSFATIENIEKLANLPAFVHAANGDKVLFYTKAKKVYIYRPSTKVLVGEGPFTMPVITPPPGSTKGASTSAPALPDPQATPVTVPATVQ